MNVKNAIGNFVKLSINMLAKCVGLCVEIGKKLEEQIDTSKAARFRTPSAYLWFR